MIDRFDLREAGDAAVWLRLRPAIDPAVNAQAIAIAGAIRHAGYAGVRDVVSTYCAVAVHFDPLQADLETITTRVLEAVAAPPVGREPQVHEIPVAYGGEHGPDLSAVAAYAGLSRADVIARHTAVPYRVYMLGFQPGFAYLGLVDPRLAVPRHASPRLQVPAGAVGIAARQTGIYPSASPGGWQIIGRALEPVVDRRTLRPRFAPGDTVTFVADAREDGFPAVDPEAIDAEPTPRRVTVVQPGLFTSIQDGGRWGDQGSGVPVGGAMDWSSHALANVLVGNAPDAPGLEVTISGPELRFEQETRLAVAGADLQATLDRRPLPLLTPAVARAGSVLRFGDRIAGARAYVGVGGGVQRGARWPVTRLVAGEVLFLGEEGQASPEGTVSAPPAPAGGARLRVLRGPQHDEVPRGCLEAVLSTRFMLSPQANRMGYRLVGATLPGGGAEMISDATFPGAIQVPPSGEPILLMADRQTTGGYPQVATVISADLPVAAQLAPGDWVEFVECSRAEAVAALAARKALVRDRR